MGRDGLWVFVMAILVVAAVAFVGGRLTGATPAVQPPEPSTAVSAPQVDTSAIQRKVADALRDHYDEYWGDDFWVHDSLMHSVARNLEDLGPEVTPDLLVALQDESPLIRNAAATAFGRLGGEDVVAVLLDAGVKQPAPNALVVAEALARIGKPALGPALAAVKSTHAEVRRVAIMTLGLLGAREAVPALVAQLGQGDWRHDLDVIRALAQIGDPSAIPALEKAIEQEPEVAFSWPAAQALADIDPAAALRILPAVLHGAESDHFCVPIVVAEVLGSLGDRGIAQLKPLLDSKSEGVSIAAAFGLAKAGAPGGLEALLLALTDAHLGCAKDYLVVDIAEARPREVAAMLASGQAPLQARHELASILGNCTTSVLLPPPVRQALATAAESDPDAKVRECAQQALEHRRNKTRIEYYPPLRVDR